MLNLLLGIATLAAQAQAVGTHPPEIEARLQPIIGDWTIPGQESSYREQCEWYRARAFVVCTSEDSSDNSSSVSIIGYSRIGGHYTYHNYSSSGSSNSRVAFPEGERGLVFILERRVAAGIQRATTHLTPEADGRVHFREERSLNGGPWTEAADFYYVPRNREVGRR